ncbi:MAG: SAM-dependent methyltransferase [Pseudomonadota bacterium]
MTPLLALLKRRIAAEGPITVATYMAEVLGHPKHGYYMTRDPLGQAGDFTTAPEISQVFGELLGLWCADVWLRLGRPDPVLWLELGPGRGTLMQDAWRATKAVPGFHQAVRLYLLETSPVLRQRQAALLQDAGPSWIERLADLPDGPLLAIANEFFDALPIRQFQMTETGWRERLIAWDEINDALSFALAPHEDPAMHLIPSSVRQAPPGAIAEICPTGISIASELGRRIGSAGGSAAIIDYGPLASAAGDSFQAVRGHEFADPLDRPGESDLTAHVDFRTLAKAATEAGTAVDRLETQRAFLTDLGIAQRAAALRANASREQREAIDAALHRLTGTTSDAMGELFKVLTLVSPGLATDTAAP